MKIDESVVKRVATNARISLTDDEVAKLKQVFYDVIEAFSKIKEVNTEDVEMSIQPIPVQNIFREDTRRDCISQEQALSNTEHKKDGYFKGPKIL